MTLIFVGVSGNSQTLTGLSTNLDFQKYLNNQKAFYQKATDFITLDEINMDKALTEEELPVFYKLFGINELEYSSFLNSQKLLMDKIAKKYKINSTNQAELESEIYTYYMGTLRAGSCETRYYAELSTAASVPYLGSLGCNAIILATPIAYYSCHGMVVLGQAAASYIAQQNLSDCRKRR